MKVVWRYADTPDPGAQSVILAGAALMLVLSADSWDLHMKVHSYIHCTIVSYPLKMAFQVAREANCRDLYKLDWAGHYYL